MAWVATLIIGLLIVTPELLAILGGSHEPRYLTGYAVGRLLIVFVIAGIFTGTTARGSGFSHTRFNITAFLIGLFVFIAQLNARGVF